MQDRLGEAEVDSRLVPDAVDLVDDSADVVVGELAVDVVAVGATQDVDVEGEQEERVARGIVEDVGGGVGGAQGQGERARRKEYE
jgi:hypothetical protein